MILFEGVCPNFFCPFRRGASIDSPVTAYSCPRRAGLCHFLRGAMSTSHIKAMVLGLALLGYVLLIEEVR